MQPITDQLQFTPGLPVDQLQTELFDAYQITGLGNRKVARCLYEMKRRKAHILSGHKDAVHYAEARLGMSKRSAQEYVNVGMRLEDLPLVDAAIVTGEISWSKLKILVRVVVPETQTEWIERAKQLNTAKLSIDVARCERGQSPKKIGDSGLPERRMRVTSDLLLANHELWEQAKRKLSAECSTQLSNEDMMIQSSRMILSTDADGTVEGRTAVKHSPFQLIIHQDAEGTWVHTSEGDVPLSEEQARLLAEQAEQVPAARPVKNPDGKTPAWQVRRVIARDNNRCQNCNDASHLQVHHVEFRENGGQTEEDVLASLCSDCHSMVHRGLLQMHGDAKDGFVFLDRSGEPVDSADTLSGSDRLSQPDTVVHFLPVTGFPPPKNPFDIHVRNHLHRTMRLSGARTELAPQGIASFWGAG